VHLRLIDPHHRVSRLLHRTTRGSELIYLDLRFGFRGEIFCEGGDGEGHNFFEVRCRSTREPYRWDAANEKFLIQVQWPARALRRLLTSWSKGTLIALLAPIDVWTPSSSKSWTSLADHDEDPNP